MTYQPTLNFLSGAFLIFVSFTTNASITDVHLRVLKQPSPAVINGKNNFIYELVIDNTSSMDIAVQEITGDGQSIGEFKIQDELLNSRFKLLGTINFDSLKDWLNPGLTPTPVPPLPGVVPAGRSALVFLQFVADLQIPIPTSIRHSVKINSLSGAFVQTLELDIFLTLPDPLVLGSPFSTGTWFPFNGPEDESRHRRSVIRLYDGYFIAQRFAIDWMQVGADGSLLTAQASSQINSSYLSYGVAIVAVADGTIEAITDDIPENTPDTNTRAVTINLQTITGNSVILNLSKNRYAVYAHLQPGRINVKPGDHVKRGQIIGYLGNSGNSTAPHLHFHVCDGPSPLECQGIPYVIDQFGHQLAKLEGETMSQLKVTGVGPSTQAHNELIWTNQLVTFSLKD